MRQFYRRREVEEFVPVHINLAAQQAIELTRPRWRDVPQEQGITILLQTDFQEDLPAVMGNEGEIRQAVTNLILNAIDAMPEGGTLTLRTRDGGNGLAGVVLEVADTGSGMAEEIQERVFEPFFSTKGERGSGMGLATVYGTMQRHGGEVQLISNVGQGTIMRLIFPVHQLVTEIAVDEVPLTPSLMRILYVDDEPLLREALQEVLGNEGHTVVVADGGRAGLQAFREAVARGEPFDVVITDLGMPYVDGRKVAQVVKAEAPGTPVILLTGWGRRMQAENEVPEGIDFLLPKPPTLESLNRALVRIMLEQ
jgi:CheY-like chemotaxis protein